jgi:hypothetical protein
MGTHVSLTTRAVTHDLSIRAVQADALFVSALQRSEEPSAEQVRRAVTAAVRAFGSQGCAERVAQEFGDHPEAAATRMRWALRLASDSFTSRSAPAGTRAFARQALAYARHAA